MISSFCFLQWIFTPVEFFGQGNGAGKWYVHFRTAVGEKKKTLSLLMFLVNIIFSNFQCAGCMVHSL